jgi:hypothetical protein
MPSIFCAVLDEKKKKKWKKREKKRTRNMNAIRKNYCPKNPPQMLNTQGTQASNYYLDKDWRQEQ